MLEKVLRAGVVVLLKKSFRAGVVVLLLFGVESEIRIRAPFIFRFELPSLLPMPRVERREMLSITASATTPLSFVLQKRVLPLLKRVPPINQTAPRVVLSFISMFQYWVAR